MGPTATMSDDESAWSDAERKKKQEEGANFLKNRQQMKMSELDEQLAEYIAEWRKQRQKEEDELKKLKEKQAKRKILRAEEEKKLTEKKKAEEERKLREESERKQKEQEQKRLRLEEAEKKRQSMMKGSNKDDGGIKKFGKSGGDKFSNIQAAKGELGKTREQLAEEKKIALSIRVEPLNVDAIGASSLRDKATEMWNLIIKLETEKYDMEERMKRQDYDLRELKERQKQQLRAKALKRGLDAEALTGKHPPKIQTASKFERRTDRRTYEDKKKLFEGGWDVVHKEVLQKVWEAKYDEFMNRHKSKLPKWFGERPGKKSGDVEDDDDEEVEEDFEVPPPPEPEYEEEEE